MNRREMIFSGGLTIVSIVTEPQSRPIKPQPLVSLIRIIANPEKFDGMSVRVIGYLDYAGLDDALGVYVSENDARNVVLSNSVAISGQITKTPSMPGRYVVFNAKYIASNWGYQNGELTDVSELHSWDAGDIKR